MSPAADRGTPTGRVLAGALPAGVLGAVWVEHGLSRAATTPGVTGAVWAALLDRRWSAGW